MRFWRWLAGGDVPSAAQRDAWAAERRELYAIGALVAVAAPTSSTSASERWDVSTGAIPSTAEFLAGNDISALAATLRCPKCDPPRPIDSWSDENDYICDVHGFVNPIRDDGAIISGNGVPGEPAVIGWKT